MSKQTHEPLSRPTHNYLSPNNGDGNGYHDGGLALEDVDLDIRATSDALAREPAVAVTDDEVEVGEPSGVDPQVAEAFIEDKRIGDRIKHLRQRKQMGLVELGRHT
ncbi:MAG: hypothetical protein ACRYFU_07130, partial [Janthinobacterium lividum]